MISRDKAILVGTVVLAPLIAVAAFLGSWAVFMIVPFFLILALPAGLLVYAALGGLAANRATALILPIPFVWDSPRGLRSVDLLKGFMTGHLSGYPMTSTANASCRIAPNGNAHVWVQFGSPTSNWVHQAHGRGFDEAVSKLGQKLVRRARPLLTLDVAARNKAAWDLSTGLVTSRLNGLSNNFLAVTA